MICPWKERIFCVRPLVWEESWRPRKIGTRLATHAIQISMLKQAHTYFMLHHSVLCCVNSRSLCSIDLIKLKYAYLGEDFTTTVCFGYSQWRLAGCAAIGACLPFSQPANLIGLKESEVNCVIVRFNYWQNASTSDHLLCEKLFSDKIKSSCC